jgi:phage terminase large subunit-like protein
LRVPTGIGQGEPLKLEEFQKELIRGTFDPADSHGRRKIRRALWSVARKNGKTALSAGLVLVFLVGPEAKPNSSILSAASDREQAAHIYQLAKQMIELDPELSAMCGCMDSVKRIVCYHNGSHYKALAADGRRQHGGNPRFVIYDELAQALDRELFDVLATSFGAQEEALLLAISTQSSDPQHIMTEMADDAIKHQEGTLGDPYFYGKVYAVPEGADIYDEENWKLANPGLGTIKSIEHMRALAYKARKSPSAEAAFRALELNQRVDGLQALVNSRDWRACQKPFDDDSMRGLKCYGGLDLSSRVDLSAFTLSWVQPDTICVATKTWFWTHGHDLADREAKDGARYREWAEQKWLRVLPGRSISFKAVVRDIAAIIAGHDLQAVAFDRFRIDELKREMEYEGIPEDMFKLIEHGQGFAGMAPAVDALEARVIEHTLHHDGNPIVTYCLSNVKVISDPAGNRKFDKRDRNRRIDGAVTLAMSLSAIAKAEKPEVKPPSVYLKRGMRVL